MRSLSELNPSSVEASDPRTMLQFARDLLSLTKPRLSSLVLLTTAGSMLLSGHSLSAANWLLIMIGTAGTVGAANALNCYWERERDALMTRTLNRPLPAKRMEPVVALIFALSLGLVSVPMLFVGANVLTGLLGLMALASYVLLYTPMKPKTGWAMLVGAVPGALPPLMGWTAATGTISAVGVLLFAILFFWQLPHFIAIALFRKSDYVRAGFKSVPIEKGDPAARFQAVLYSVALVAASVALYWTHVAGIGYLMTAVVVGTLFLSWAVKGWVQNLGEVWARKLFLFSLVYLTALFIALGVDGGFPS